MMTGVNKTIKYWS